MPCAAVCVATRSPLWLPSPSHPHTHFPRDLIAQQSVPPPRPISPCARLPVLARASGASGARSMLARARTAAWLALSPPVVLVVVLAVAVGTNPGWSGGEALRRRWLSGLRERLSALSGRGASAHVVNLGVASLGRDDSGVFHLGAFGEWVPLPEPPPPRLALGRARREASLLRAGE